MRERQQQAPFGTQAPPGRRVVARLRPQRLDDAVAAAVVAPGLVHVELAAAGDALHQLVAVAPHATAAVSGACSCHRRAYVPPAATSSSWVPRSTTRPASRTTMHEASRTLKRLCEITIVVRPLIRRRMGSSTRSLDAASSPVVGSSSRSTGA